MATLYIGEFCAIGGGGNFPIAGAQQPPIVEQTVAIGGASVQSSAFNAKTTLLRIHCDVVCSILFGTNPTATAAKARLGANQTEYFSVPAGLSYKVAVITNT